MLKTRVITAVLALIPMIWIFLKGDSGVIRMAFSVLVGISAFEMGNMVFPALQSRFSTDEDGKKFPPWLLFVIILLSLALYSCLVFGGNPAIGYVGIALLAGILIGIFGAKSVDLSIAYAAGLTLSLIYCVFPWVAIFDLYKMGNGPRLIFFLCAIVWCGDTGAYFSGRSLGRHKLAPRMSPNKTWEGSIGGIIASFLGAAVLKAFYGDSFVSWPVLVACSVFGGMFGQLGDLAESTFKRFAGVKDSGRIFPGHGGFLDRVDGLLFAAPIIWFILYQFGS